MSDASINEGEEQRAETSEGPTFQEMHMLSRMHEENEREKKIRFRVRLTNSINSIKNRAA